MNTQIKTIGIIPNIDRDKHLSVTKRLITLCKNLGIRALLPPETAVFLQNAEGVTYSPRVYSESDFLVVLGGDGTVLRAARQACLNDVPLLGVNLGHLGYLTDTEKRHAERAVSMVIDGECALESRMMLHARLISENGETLSDGLALNDVTVTAAERLKMVGLRLYVNGKFFDDYRADGVIAATPTGSTAYNLSAGGPILKPDAEMFAITPICPHSLRLRPVVLPSSDTLEITVDAGGLFACDGEAVRTFGGGEKLIITRASVHTTIIRTANLEFFDRLRLKMIGTNS